MLRPRSRGEGFRADGGGEVLGGGEEAVAGDEDIDALVGDVGGAVEDFGVGGEGRGPCCGRGDTETGLEGREEVGGEVVVGLPRHVLFCARWN